MKVLNLDKLATGQKRQLVIGGVSFPIEEMTVSNFIETTKAAERITDAPIAEQIEATIEMVARSVPTLKVEIMRALSLEALKTIVSFVRGDDDIEGVETTEEVGADGKK